MDRCNKCNRPKHLPGEVLTALCECETEAGQVDAVVNSTLIIDLNKEFDGGSISVRGDVWEIIKKYKGKTLSMKTDCFDIDISIKK